jgi:hypothetical protein
MVWWVTQTLICTFRQFTCVCVCVRARTHQSIHYILYVLSPVSEHHLEQIIPIFFKNMLGKFANILIFKKLIFSSFIISECKENAKQHFDHYRICICMFMCYWIEQCRHARDK